MITAEINFRLKPFLEPQWAGCKGHRYAKGALILSITIYLVLFIMTDFVDELSKTITKKRNFVSKKSKIFQRL